MATLDDVLAGVTAEGSQIDSLTAYLKGLKDQIAAALANSGITPEVQAKIDAVFAAQQSNAAKIQAALNAGTPAASVNPAASS